MSEKSIFKQMKKSRIFTSLLTILTLSACNVEQKKVGAEGAQVEEKVVNVYTSRHYDADKELYKKFEEETGIKVNVKRGVDDQLIALLQSEDSLTHGDLLLTADVGRLAYAKELGLYRSISSDTLEMVVPNHLQDVDNQWYALTKRARILVLDTAFQEMEGATYSELSNERFKGVLLCRSSSNIYNQSLVASMIAHYGEEGVLNTLKGWVNNFADEPSGNDRDQVKKIASGKGKVAIVNTYYLGKMVASKDEMERKAMASVKVFFPNQNTYGSHINVSGGGVLRHAKHPRNAQLLLEYLVSAEAHKVFAQANYEYPVRAGVPAHDILQSWGTFKEDSLSLAQIGALNQKAITLMKKAGWN